MFTGVVEGVGRVVSVSSGLELEAPLFVSTGLKIGSSLAVDGVCLTLARRKGRRCYFDLLGETKRRTTLGGLTSGDLVNLERPLTADGRIEGHFVQGHVDGVGAVRTIKARGNQKSVKISGIAAVRPFLVEKGSIAVNGVSLTIGVIEPDGFWVHLIPHTIRSTSFKTLRQGDPVNLEADILLKWLSEKLFKV